MAKRCLLILTLLCLCAFSAFSLSSGKGSKKGGSDGVQPGNILISGGLTVGSVTVATFTESMIGFDASVDYALARGLTVGGELGYAAADLVGETLSIVPFAARLGYHPNVGVRNLDVYGLFKLGLGFVSFVDESYTAVGVGIDLGGRYFFNGKVGAFAEVGYDGYNFKVYGSTVKARKIFTLGLTYKM
jgi:hypothetical protein